MAGFYTTCYASLLRRKKLLQKRLCLAQRWCAATQAFLHSLVQFAVLTLSLRVKLFKTLRDDLVLSPCTSLCQRARDSSPMVS